MSQKDQWIVDIRGVKKGPMSTLEVVEALISRQVRVVHRVSRDGNSFKAICNEEYFEGFIQRLIEKLTPLADKETALKALEGSEKDYIELSGVHKIDVNSLGISEQLEHAKQLQRASADLSMLRKILIEIRTNRKVVINTADSERESDELHPDDQDVYINEGRNFHPLKGGNKYLFLALGLALIVFLGLDYQKRQQMLHEQERAEKEAEEKISRKYLGANSASKKVDSKTQESDNSIVQAARNLLSLPNKLSGLSSYAGLPLVLAGQEGIAKIQVNGKTVTRVEAGRVFEKLLERAATRILEDQHEKAEELLLTAMRVPFHPKADVLVMLVGVAFKIDSKSSGRMIRTQSVLKLTEKYQKAAKKNLDKLAFARFLGDFYLKNDLGMRASFRNFAAIYPGELEVGSLGYRYLVSWESLLAECINIYNNHSQDPWANAMLTGCLLRTSKMDKADAYARYSLSKLPNEENVKALAGRAFLLAGKSDEAAEVLFQPVKGSKSRAANRLTARREFCDLEKDHPACVKRSAASREDAIKRSIRRSRKRLEK